MKFNCDNCGPLEYALFDGYGIGDRLLEGVKFEIRPKGKKYEARTGENDKEYMSDLNEAKWLKKIALAVEDDDILECPKCHGDIDGPGMEA